MRRIFEYLTSLGEKVIITCDTKNKSVSAVMYICKGAKPEAVNVDDFFNPHMSHKEVKARAEFLKACRKRSEQSLRYHLHCELCIPFYSKGFREVTAI